jgi:hypothetical protein
VVRVLAFSGCACLLVMVLTHVAERVHILPGMGWGLPNSRGHYLDLISAIAGVALLIAAGATRLFARPANPRRARGTESAAHQEPDGLQ